MVAVVTIPAERPRDHLVWVIIYDELPIVNLQRIIANVGRYAQNLIRTLLAEFTWDVAKLSIGEPKALGPDLAEVAIA